MTIIDFLNPLSQYLRLHGVAFLVLMSLNAHAQDADDLFTQIRSLQDQMNVPIIGLERIQNEAKINTRGNPEQQIEQLLASFNHVVSRNKKGKIERIVIINKKQKQEDQRIVLPTSLQGNHLTVSVSLSGDGQLWQTLDMLIDTGADLVVLPESMIAQLGLSDSPFRQEKIQTANGLVNAKIGKLKELRIASETVENIDVAFIADALLGQNRLLGMSALGHYQVTIDDKSQSITLLKK